MNPRSDNNEAAVNFEANALDIKSGIEFLRKQPGITKILLWGHSGGGPATSFYQAVAEKGPSYCRGPNKLTECDETLAGLPKADGLILVDAHPGISVNLLRSLNPAVVDEGDPKKLDPALDPFNPANGYKDGAPQLFRRLQAEILQGASRPHEPADRPGARRTEGDADGSAPYPDNDAMVITRFEGARLMELDPSIHHGTLKPQKLLKNDGTVVTQIVESVRMAGTRLRQAQRQLRGRCADSDAAVVPERERDPGEGLARRDRLVLEQQLDGLRASEQSPSRRSSRPWGRTTSSATARSTTRGPPAATRSSSSSRGRRTAFHPAPRVRKRPDSMGTVRRTSSTTWRSGSPRGSSATGLLSARHVRCASRKPLAPEPRCR